MRPRSRSTATPIERASAAKRESKYIDFKEQFDPASDGEWCEMLKDFAALADSGGGLIVVGRRNNGTASGADVAAVLDLDPATITDKLFKYTGKNYGGFEVHEAKLGKQKLAVIAIDGVTVPIVFTKPGTYLVDATGKQKTAFSQGTVYFRHGAKSEPAVSDDLRAFIEDRVEAARESWLGNVRKVIEAPTDAQVAIYTPTSPDPSGGPVRVQLTTDADAPVYGKLNPDDTHPYRQKELIGEVNRRLAGSVTINPYDIQCVRAVENLDEKSAPQFCHRPKFGSMQYSEPFVAWLLDCYRANKDFFANERARNSERIRAR